MVTILHEGNLVLFQGVVVVLGDAHFGQHFLTMGFRNNPPLTLRLVFLVVEIHTAGVTPPSPTQCRVTGRPTDRAPLRTSTRREQYPVIPFLFYCYLMFFCTTRTFCAEFDDVDYTYLYRDLVHDGQQLVASLAPVE